METILNPVHLFFAACLIFMSSVQLMAGTWTSLPSPEYADTEVSRHLAMRPWKDVARTLRLRLSFTASSSNNVEIAFGCDANEDGILGAEEARLILGWECGSWKLHPVVEGHVLTDEPSAESAKTLTFEMSLTQEGKPKSVRICEGETPLFEELEINSPPAWLFDPAWDWMSLSARGVDCPQEQFEIEQTTDGLIIYFR